MQLIWGIANGVEFLMSDFDDSHGILHQKSCVESPPTK